MNRPDGVLFDLGDTLLTDDGAVDFRAGQIALLETARSGHGISPEIVRDRVRALRRDLEPRRRESWLEHPAFALDRLIYDGLGIEFDLSPAEMELRFWQAALPPLPPTPGVLDLLDALASREVPIGVLSNWSASVAVLERTLERSGLDPTRFDVLVTSGHYALRKPHPEIFRVTAARLGVAPDRTWYCGNMVDLDVAGSNAAGMTSLWYAPDGEEVPDEPRPDLVVRHWDEVTAIVRAW
jgi:FMN phosphatase YigB (HAD superfamily)